jgi:hypothetical protein
LAITAIALAIVRLLTASRPFWAWEKVPVWLQKALPAALMAIAALPTAIEKARSWVDVLVGIVVTAGVWFTASRGDTREPEAKDGGPRESRTNTDPEPTHGPRSIPPGPLALLLLAGAVALSMISTACSASPLTSKRCDFTNPEYTAHVATCRREIEDSCLLNADSTPREDCTALVECERWRKEQCQ